MTITHSIKIDMVKRPVTPRVHAMQYDTNTRIIEIELTANGEKWLPPDGVYFALSYRKPDGKKGFYNKLAEDVSAITVEENKVAVTLAHQVLTTTGTVDAALVMNNEAADRLASFPLEICVEADPSAGTTQSDDYFNCGGIPQVSLKINHDGKGNVALENVPTTADDGIAESGTINGWDYIKYKSGLAYCARTATATVKTTDWKDSGMMSFPLLSDFGLFWTKEMVAGKDIQFPYPFPFVKVPTEVPALTNGTVWFPLQLISTSGGALDKTCAYRLCTYKVPEQNIKVTLSFEVFGWWKEGGGV